MSGAAVRFDETLFSASRWMHTAMVVSMPVHASAWIVEQTHNAATAESP
jgi:hypothetical protein